MEGRLAEAAEEIEREEMRRGMQHRAQPDYRKLLADLVEAMETPRTQKASEPWYAALNALGLTRNRSR